jgi:hypothetical protein
MNVLSKFITAGILLTGIGAIQTKTPQLSFNKNTVNREAIKEGIALPKDGTIVDYNYINTAKLHFDNFSHYINSMTSRTARNYADYLHKYSEKFYQGAVKQSQHIK